MKQFWNTTTYNVLWHIKGLVRGKSLANLKQVVGNNARPRESKSFSGLMNLKEAGRVSVMNTAVAHQRMLLRYKHQGSGTINQGQPRLTTREIQRRRTTGLAATISTLHDHLHVSKRFAKNISHSLTNYQQRGRVEQCEFIQRKFYRGCWKSTWEMLTGDETRTYQCWLETMTQSAVWLFPGEVHSNNNNKARRAR